jgi:hypothetical protein
MKGAMNPPLAASTWMGVSHLIRSTNQPVDQPSLNPMCSLW